MQTKLDVARTQAVHGRAARGSASAYSALGINNDAPYLRTGNTQPNQTGANSTNKDWGRQLVEKLSRNNTARRVRKSSREKLTTSTDYFL